MKRNFYKSIVFAALIAFAGTSLAGPISQGGQPDVYTRNQSMQMGRVVEGTVVQVREVTIGSGTTANTIGAVVGGVAGAAIGQKHGAAAMTVATLLGGAAGTLFGSMAGQTKGDEIVVNLGNQGYQSIVQERGAFSYSPGQKVLVMINGMEARIVSKL